MLTIFSIPKAFEGHNGVIQRNALRSWSDLGKEVEIILLGNDPGVAEAAQRFGVAHFGGLEVGKYGSPRLDSAFDHAIGHARHDCLCYVNADIILPEALLRVVQALRAGFKRFLAVGRRWDIEITEDIEDVAALRARVDILVREQGSLHSPTGMDFFLFPNGSQFRLPPFIVGRPVWDNWMVFAAKARRIPVVDITNACRVVHQNHDYRHVPGGTRAWEGPEADYNRTLAFDRSGPFFAAHYTINAADWVLSPDRGIRRQAVLRRLAGKVNRAAESVPWPWQDRTAIRYSAYADLVSFLRAFLPERIYRILRESRERIVRFRRNDKK